MSKAIALCLATFATIHQVAAAEGESQRIVVELKPVADPEISSDLRDLTRAAMDALRSNDLQ